MKIGVLGSGVVAKVLAAGFLAHGHGVMVGTRDTSKLADWKAKTAGAQVGSFGDAAAFGEVPQLLLDLAVDAASLEVSVIAAGAGLDPGQNLDALIDRLDGMNRELACLHGLDDVFA